MSDNWIDVKDRLPEARIPVWVMATNSAVVVAWRRMNSCCVWYEGCGEDERYVGGVTHWQPLPAPPTEPSGQPAPLDSVSKQSLLTQTTENTEDPTVKDSLTVQYQCKLCGDLAEWVEKDQCYRHAGNSTARGLMVPGEGCDRYGYPIPVEPAPPTGAHRDTRASGLYLSWATLPNDKTFGPLLMLESVSGDQKLTTIGLTPEMVEQLQVFIGEGRNDARNV